MQQEENLSNKTSISTEKNIYFTYQCISDETISNIENIVYTYTYILNNNIIYAHQLIKKLDYLNLLNKKGLILDQKKLISEVCNEYENLINKLNNNSQYNKKILNYILLLKHQSIKKSIYITYV